MTIQTTPGRAMQSGAEPKAETETAKPAAKKTAKKTASKPKASAKSTGKTTAAKKATAKKKVAKPTAPKADPVMDAVKKAGRKGITLNDLAEATGKTRNATHGWTWRMAKAGKVVAVEGVKPRRFKVAPASKAAK